MMIVPMMTPRPTTLDRATVVAVHHVFTTFHLVGNCVAQRPWTSFPVASDFAVLASALDTLNFSVRVNSWMPFHTVLIRTTERVLATAGSQYFLGGAFGG